MSDRILVTGSRDWPRSETVNAVLDLALTTFGVGPFVIVHGDCPTGADHLAQLWADARGVTTERHPAQGFGRWPSCGPRRNAYMVRLGAVACVGFVGPCHRSGCRTEQPHGSHGATGCLRMAKAVGILTVLIPLHY